jgi:hypothetical protein
MDWIRQIDDPNYNPPYTSSRSQIIRPETQMLESLLSRPWFNPIWVLQEAILSKSAIVYCGQKIISWDAIKRFKEFNASTNRVEHFPLVIGRQQPTADTPVAVEFQVSTELLDARHCESTDPRDKVYALLPLLSHSDINSDIVPNYSHSAARVFTDVATYLMSCIRLEFLCTVCGRSKLPGLPSWLPDWSIRLQRSILGLNQPQHRPRILRYTTGGEFIIPSRTNSQRVRSFTIDLADQNGTFSAHLRIQAYRLGKITGIGINPPPTRIPHHSVNGKPYGRLLFQQSFWPKMLAKSKSTRLGVFGQQTMLVPLASTSLTTVGIVGTTFLSTRLLQATSFTETF